MHFNNDTLKHFVELSEKKSFKEFKDYVINNNIKLNEFKDTKGENVDILIKCIDNNASLAVIDYIIINGQYETLNYEIFNKVILFINTRKTYMIDYYHEKNREDTPLACAIRNNNFELANLLMDYGADINFISCEVISQILNKTNAFFLLEKDYPMSENLIREIIWNKKWFIKQYHYYHIYDNTFILNFLMRYKYKMYVPITQIKNEIELEQRKITYDESVYYWPFKSDQYDILKIIYDHDPRPKEEIHSIIYKLLSQHYEKEKTETFLTVIKNNKFNFCIDPVFIQSLDSLILNHHFYRRKTIENLIEMNDVIQLKKYVRTNHIHLKDFNRKYNKYNDMLRSAIKYNGSIEMIKYILYECSYDNFSYDVISPDATDVVSLLFFTLSLSQYKTFNLLIEKGADIYYGGVMQYVTKKELIQVQHIKYILDYDIELNVDILNKVIDENQMELLKLIFKRYSFNRCFILKLLSYYKSKTPISASHWNTIIMKEKNKQMFLYQNAYKSVKFHGKLNTINIIYENDSRDHDHIIRELFQIFGYETYWKDSELKNKLILDIKKKKIKINVDSSYLTNLYYCGEKREKMKEFIITNNLIEFKKYINKNNIIIEYFTQPVFDFLIYAIENLEDCSDTLEMVLFLVRHYHSLDYTICDTKLNKYKSPLSCSISMNKFSFAQALLDHGAKINENINDFDLLSKLYNENSLTMINLKFILKNNFSQISSEIIKKWIKEFKNNFLSLAFKHYLYDNDKILSYLSYYKNRKSLSSQHWNSILQIKKYRVSLNYEWFHEAIINKNNESLQILFNYFGNYSRLFHEELSNLKELINIAVEKNNQFFFEQLLSREIFNFEKNVTFETLLQISVKYNHFNLVKFIIEKSFHHKTFNVEIVNIKKIIIYLRRMEDDSIIDVFINQLLNFRDFHMNNTIFEDMIIPLTKLNNDEIIKKRLDNILNHEKFNFGAIEIKKIITLMPKIIDINIRKYFIEKIILHQKLEFNTITIENILLGLNKITENNNLVIPLIIETMKSSKRINHDTYNIENIDANKILISSIKYNNLFMVNYLLNEFLKFRDNIKYITYLEKPLLISSRIDNLNLMKVLLEKLLSNMSNINNSIDTTTTTTTITITNNNNNYLNIDQNIFDFSYMKKFNTSYLSLILNIIIKLKYIQQVKNLIEDQNLKNTININCKDQNGEYPILVVYHFIKYDDRYFELLNFLLNRGVDYSVRDNNGNTLFMLAIKQRNYRVINELFKRNIPLDFDMNIINSSPIRKAIYNNQLDEVRTLIKFNRKSIISTMKTIFNSYSNNSRRIKTDDKYISHPSLWNSYFTLLSLSYLLNHIKIFNYLLNCVDINEFDFNGYNILHFALLREDTDTIKKLIKLGVDINHYHKYLFYPSSVDIVLYLKNKDIFLNLINNKRLVASSLNTINEQGETPLMTLLRMNSCELQNKIDLIKILLKKEWNDLNFTDRNGYNLLDYAIKENSLDIIKLLVNHGAILGKSIQKNQKEMLKFAIANDNIEIIEFFMIYDISFFTNDIIKEIIYKNRLDILKILTPSYIEINRKDDDNHTFLFYAYEYENNDIIKYLIEQGANKE